MKVFVVMQTDPDRSSEMRDRPMDVKTDKQAADDLAKGLGGWVEEFMVNAPAGVLFIANALRNAADKLRGETVINPMRHLNSIAMALYEHANDLESAANG